MQSHISPTAVLSGIQSYFVRLLIPSQDKILVSALSESSGNAWGFCYTHSAPISKSTRVL